MPVYAAETRPLTELRKEAETGQSFILSQDYKTAVALAKGDAEQHRR
jgi:hypothetical protein